MGFDDRKIEHASAGQGLMPSASSAAATRLDMAEFISIVLQRIPVKMG
jgi:hypothetical protein